MRLSVAAAVAALLLLLACRSTMTAPATPAAPVSQAAPVAPPLDPASRPLQRDRATPESFSLVRDGRAHRLTKIAEYTVTGIMVSIETYTDDRGAALSPCDIALVFGKLVADARWRRIDWSQSGRWYWWSYDVDDIPGGNDFIVANSSNNHIVPADTRVAAAVRRLDTGKTVRLSGFLIDIEETGVPDGFTWRTSRSRTDTGDGSCEIIWLTGVEQQ